MKKYRVSAVLIALLTFCLLLPGIASAEKTAGVTFSWVSDGQTLSVSPVKTSQNGYVLFLPGSCDVESLTVTLTGCGSLQWDELQIPDGGSLDITAWIGGSAQLTFSNGYRMGSLRVMRGSEIPSLFFTIDATELKYINANKNNDITQEASVVILDGDGGTVCAGTLDSFHLRGNSTRHAPKKPYQFKLSEKADLFGMGAGTTWLLLANWYDVSLIRNEITLDLCRELGLRGTPECRQVDVYLNGSYNGTYLLTEKIQLKSSRLDITNMEDEQRELLTEQGLPLSGFRLKMDRRHSAAILRWHDVPVETEDITGGYLLEIEKPMHFTNNEENAGFMTDGNMCVLIKEPTWVSEKAADYIAGIVNDFHNAVLNADGISPDTGRSYSEYIDMPSFARKVIVEEFCANFDVGAASQFMYKDSDAVDGLIYAGPGWDYDLTYGNKASGMHDALKIDYVYTRSSNTRHLYHWLLTHSEFRTLTRSLFESELIPAAEILLGRREAPEGSALRSLDSYISEIADSAEMNFTLWNTQLISDVYNPSGRTFADATAYLKDWITQRFDALTAEWLTD